MSMTCQWPNPDLFGQNTSPFGYWKGISAYKDLVDHLTEPELNVRHAMKKKPARSDQTWKVLVRSVHNALKPLQTNIKFLHREVYKKFQKRREMSSSRSYTYVSLFHQDKED